MMRGGRRRRRRYFGQHRKQPNTVQAHLDGRIYYSSLDNLRALYKWTIYALCHVIYHQREKGILGHARELPNRQEAAEIETATTQMVQVPKASIMFGRTRCCPYILPKRLRKGAVKTYGMKKMLRIRLYWLPWRFSIFAGG